MTQSDVKIIKPGWVKRIAVGTFLPPVLGPLLLITILMTRNLETPSLADLAALAFTVIFAFVFVGIQSFLSSLVMEFVINPRVKDNRMVYVLGLTLGVLSTSILWAREAETTLILVVGACVGGVVAWVLRRMYRGNGA